MTELAFDPSALRAAIFDARDEAVAMPRVVIVRVDDDEIARCIRKEIAWEFFDVLHGDRDDDEVATMCCVADRDGRRACLPREISE